jgi:hypothetical protein
MPNTVAVDQVANKHGCLPPAGCRVPVDTKLPQVAVGNEIFGPYEATFLIEPGYLELCLLEMVEQSSTLKAWFAYKVKVKGLKDTCDLEPKFPTWERVWELVQRRNQNWGQLYQTNKDKGSLAN